MSNNRLVVPLDTMAETTETERLQKADVAVLLPVYNNQAGLDASLNSLRPEKPRFHAVIVDDGSSVPIAIDRSAYGFPIELVRLEPNVGITAALNRGLQFIFENGFKYIARLDSSDLWVAGRLDAQRDFLESHTEYALVGTWAQFVDADGRPTLDWKAPTDDRRIREEMYLRNCFVHPSVMIRASALDEVGIYDARYRHVEDYELFFRLMRKFKAANLPEFLCRYERDIRTPGVSLRYRRLQLVGRLRTLLANADISSPGFYAGVAAAVANLALPYRFTKMVKSRFWRS